MGDIVEIKDPITYGVDDENNFISICVDSKGNALEVSRSGGVILSRKNFDYELGFEKHHLKQLFIGWLALEYPDCLKFDD